MIGQRAGDKVVAADVGLSAWVWFRKFAIHYGALSLLSSHYNSSLGWSTKDVKGAWMSVARHWTDLANSL
eukprot:SAG31_NODE_754_length_12324_cov_3.930061_8_plen_70_part_00